MHAEFASFKVFSFNLRQKNAERWGRKVVKAVREAYDRCIILLQEASSWKNAEIANYAIFSERGKDCAIGVPASLRSSVDKDHHDERFTAIQIHNVGFISVHLPHSGRPDHEFYDTMTRISALIELWKSSQRPLKHLVLGGDLNVSLPAYRLPITGPHIYERPTHSKHRVDSVLDWLAGLQLRASNTWVPELTRSQQTWTWKNSKGHRAQLDYICPSESLLGRAWVEASWPIKSDHCPISAALWGLTPLGQLRIPVPSSVGWAPKTN